MAHSRHDDDDKFGKKYERLGGWRTDMFALVDDDDETAWRKSGARTQKRRFVTGQKMVASAEQRQKAKKQLENLAQDVAKQLGVESMFSAEALARIADRVKREKGLNEQQMVMLASGAMPSGAPSWVEFEIRKHKANQEYQYLAANPAMLRVLMLNAPNTVLSQMAQRMGFVPEISRDWVQDFLAADKRERAMALETQKLNKLSPIPGNALDLHADKMRFIPNVLGVETGLRSQEWTAMRMGHNLGVAFNSNTRDMHGLMNPALKQDAAQKIFQNSPVTKPFAEADMSLRETKMLYSKLHMKGMDDGQIARSAHVAVALAQVRRDVDPRAAGTASREAADFHRNANTTLTRELRNANQNEVVKPLPVVKVASHVVENADRLQASIQPRSTDANAVARRQNFADAFSQPRAPTEDISRRPQTDRPTIVSPARRDEFAKAFERPPVVMAGLPPREENGKAPERVVPRSANIPPTRHAEFVSAFGRNSPTVERTVPNIPSSPSPATPAARRDGFTVAFEASRDADGRPVHARTVAPVSPTRGAEFTSAFGAVREKSVVHASIAAPSATTVRGDGFRGAFEPPRDGTEKVIPASLTGAPVTPARRDAFAAAFETPRDGAIPASADGAVVTPARKNAFAAAFETPGASIPGVAAAPVVPDRSAVPSGVRADAGVTAAPNPDSGKRKVAATKAFDAIAPTVG